MPRVAAGAFAVASVVLACGSVGTPDLEVLLARPEGEAYTLLVYDDSGLVTAGKSEPSQPGGPFPIADVAAFPGRREIEIAWLGGACTHRPTLELSGNATHLRLQLRNPSDPQLLPFLPIACPAVGVPLRVTLSLTEPVQQIAVDLEVLS